MIQNGVQTTNDDWMGTTSHGKYGERMETMLAGQNIFEIEHCVYIYGLGQSMLEAPQPHTVWRTTRQIQDDEIKIDGRSTCADGSTQNRDIDPTTARPVEAETFEESSEFGHCVLT